jgi:RNA polymerase sigma-70 factor, ECF subfamily
MPVEGPTRGRAPASDPRRGYRLGGPDEELLMVKYQRGDRAAFQELVHRHHTAVFNFVLRLSLAPERAEAVTQEVFEAMVQRASSYANDAPFAPWLYRIARETCLAGMPPQPPLAGPPSSTAPKTDAATRPEAPLADLITAALADMGSELREVFLLRDICGLTLAQIAEVIGEAPLVAKARLREALERLQRAIASRDEYQRQLR